MSQKKPLPPKLERLKSKYSESQPSRAEAFVAVSASVGNLSCNGKTAGGTSVSKTRSEKPGEPRHQGPAQASEFSLLELGSHSEHPSANRKGPLLQHSVFLHKVCPQEKLFNQNPACGVLSAQNCLEGRAIT